MDMMLIKKGNRGMDTIATIQNPTHIPREKETIFYKNKEYTVLQVLWHYDSNLIFVYCKEE